MNISIYSLIFQSTQYAEWLYNAIHKNTKELQEGTAKFYFMANNATDEVLKFLKKKRYPHFTITTPYLDAQELAEKGIGWPYYLHTVYKAHNKCIEISETPLVCLIDSDIYPAEGWLTGLLDYVDKNTVVTSNLVEPPRNGSVFTNFLTREKVIIGNFGTGIDTFKEEEFNSFAKTIKKPGTKDLISYKPILFYKDTVMNVGCFPEGNILCRKDPTAQKIRKIRGEFLEFGDMALIRKLKEKGVSCLLSTNSIAYHFDNGERLRK